MIKACSIAWLLIRVQLKRPSTFVFWIALPIIFTLIVSQRGAADNTDVAGLLMSVITEHGERTISLVETNKAIVSTSGTHESVVQSSPGMMVMFTLLFMLTSASTIIWEKSVGTWRRLQVMPMRRSTILFGKLLGVYILGLLQLTVLAISNMVIFGNYDNVNFAALAAVILVFGFTAACLGMAVASLTKTLEQASIVTLILVMCISALGGAWWPLDAVPDYMQSVAFALPTYWALNGFSQVLQFGDGIIAIVPQLLALLAFGGFFLIIGLFSLRW